MSCCASLTHQLEWITHFLHRTCEARLHRGIKEVRSGFYRWMEPNKCRVIQLGVSSICRVRYCQWCVPTLLTTKPQRPHREHCPYLLLFLRNLCLSKANTLRHTHAHIHTQTCALAHMHLMNIAEQQVITHTSSVSLHCFYSLHTYRYAEKRQTWAGLTCTSSPSQQLLNTA